MVDEKINVLRDFSDTPGARYESDGKFSAQEFYKKFLDPKFKQALLSNSKLFVELDGTYGYAPSFISESFGKLSQKYGFVNVKNHLELVTIDSILKEMILKTIKKAGT